jgi:hypothetical protein
VTRNSGKSFAGIERRIAVAVFVALAALVLAAQARNVEFSRGPHGWVSSHGLAIASHADSSTGFVGYSLRFVDATGKSEYEYFDRNPVFFAAGLNLLIGRAGTLDGKVYAARQAMNVIFLASLAVAFLLVRELTGDGGIAAGAALLTFSGWYFIFYKDMVHFEQPGLLGFLLVLLAILKYQRTGGRRLLYVSALLAVSFGRGVVSLSLLALWAAIDYTSVLAAEWPKPIAATVLWLRREPVRVFAVAAALAAVYVGYNVAAEARLRGVSWSETSIVDSAARRSGFAASSADSPSRWTTYLPAIARRLGKSAVPYALEAANTGRFEPRKFRAAFLLMAAMALLAVGAFLRSVPAADRPFYFLLILSWVPWFLVMRRHTAPQVHDYTSIYFAGPLLAAFAALFGRLPPRFRNAAVAAAIALFVASNITAGAAQAKISAAESYTADFDRVLTHVRAGDVIYVDGDPKELVPIRPYALGFYLSRQTIGPAERATFAISSDRNFAPNNLTPENRVVFLFPMKRAPERVR